MDRKKNHFNPDTATYEQKCAYNFLCTLKFSPDNNNLHVDLTPDFIMEEAIYIQEKLKGDENFDEKELNSHISSFLSDSSTSPKYENRPSNLPSLNIAGPFYSASIGHNNAVKPSMKSLIIIATKMLIYQMEIPSFKEMDFCRSESATIDKQDSNFAAFETLPEWLFQTIKEKPVEYKFSDEEIWHLFNSMNDSLERTIFNMLFSARRAFVSGGKNVRMYYYSALESIADSIVKKYNIENIDALSVAFGNALSYNAQFFSDVIPEISSVCGLYRGGRKNEKEFHSRMAPLYKRIETLYDSTIGRDRAFIYNFHKYCKHDETFRKALLCIDIIDNIRLTYLKIKEQRDILGLPDLLANTPKPKQTKKETPAELSAFEQMVEYARNRFKNEEMQTIVKMLMHVYHSDEKKYAIIEQIEPEWNELHSPKTTVTVENGASYNEIHDNKKVDLTKQS